VEKLLLVEGRKFNSLMVQLSNNDHYDVEKLVDATTKYDAICEEIQLLEAKLQDLNNIDEGVGDEDISPSSSNATANVGQHDGNVAIQE
jgi:hypothetical protein